MFVEQALDRDVGCIANPTDQYDCLMGLSQSRLKKSPRLAMRSSYRHEASVPRRMPVRKAQFSILVQTEQARTGGCQFDAVVKMAGRLLRISRLADVRQALRNCLQSRVKPNPCLETVPSTSSSHRDAEVMPYFSDTMYGRRYTPGIRRNCNADVVLICHTSAATFRHLVYHAPRVR